MKKLITTTAAILLFASAASAADTKPAEQQGMMPKNMIGSDIMKTCQSHMKDGKMMDNMPKDMMKNCQEMMKNGGMMGGGMMKGGAGNMPVMDSKKPEAPKAADDATKASDAAEHEKHHPAN